MLVHDHSTGRVLDAIKRAGVEENTIVIWISDNGSTPVAGPPEYRGGSSGPFSGELGDGREGSIRVPGMIKWPGKIPQGNNNGMVSIHDFLPTLASIIDVDLPSDRAYDGIDQSDFFLGKHIRHTYSQYSVTYIDD